MTKQRESLSQAARDLSFPVSVSAGCNRHCCPCSVLVNIFTIHFHMTISSPPSITRPLTRLIQVIRSHSRLLILMFALPQQTASSLPSANCPWAWMKPLIWATLMNSGQNALPVIGDYRSDFLQQLYWSLYTSLEKQKESCWRLQFDMSLVVSKSLLSFARFSQEPTLHLKWIVRIAVERTLVAAGLNGIPVDCFDICWPDTQLFGHWSPVTLITSLMLYFSVTTLGFLVSSSTNCNKSVPRLLKK